jgi:hypothetical protein
MKTLSSIIFNLIFLTCFGQNWTPPKNISNQELSSFPDIAIDNNGVIHVVYREKLESNWWKIMYTKSINDGNTWSTPFDLSQNDDLACHAPHIVAGSDGKLYVTYDYNIGNIAQGFIHMKIFDGTSWGQTINVSETPYAQDNILIRDNNNRIYVFWYKKDGTDKFCYRTFYNNIWSEIKFPYEADHWLVKAVADSLNILHCIGSYYYNNKDFENKMIYFTYDPVTDHWSDVEMISDSPVNVSGDIALDNSGSPHFLWNEHLSNSWPWIQGSVYCYRTAPNVFSNKEIIEDHSFEERIHVNTNDVTNVFLSRDYESGWAFRHYYKIWDGWHGIRIDTSTTFVFTGAASIAEYNEKLYVVYYKCVGEGNCDIKFTKSNLITFIPAYSEKTEKDEIRIFPNPFTEKTTISFSLHEGANVSLVIYDLYGNLVTTIADSFLPEGTYKFQLQTESLNQSSLKKGIYLVQLSTGYIVSTQKLTYLKDQ